MIRTNTKNDLIIYGKKDIMKLLNCESDKALKILKVMYQMKSANKIGKEYYVKRDTFFDFLDEMSGHEILL